MLPAFVRSVIGKARVKQSFVQNLSFAVSGSMVTVVLQLLFSPIMTRIYGPEAYGLFSLFNAVAMNLCSLAFLQYDKAVILPRDNSEFKSMLSLCLLSLCVFLLLLSGWLYFFPGQFIALFGLAKVPTGALFWLPVAILVFALVQLSQEWIVKNQAFKEALYYGSPNSIATRFFNVGYGLATNGNIGGLILGESLGKIASLLINYGIILRRSVREILRVRVSWMDIRAVAWKFRKFPLVDLPATWVNVWANQLPVFFLTRNAGLEKVGYFSLATSLLEMPVRILGYSVLSVFTVKATELYEHHRERLGENTFKLYMGILAMAFPCFAAIAICSEFVFPIAFGHKWLEAGRTASALAFFYMSRTLVEPLTGIYMVAMVQQKQFVIQVVNFALRWLVLYLVFDWGGDWQLAVSAFALIGGLVNTVQLYQITALSHVKPAQRFWMLLPLFVGLLLSMLMAYLHHRA